jgi:hypothetical protein
MKKSILSIICILFLFSNFHLHSANGNFGGGTGSAESPFIIEDATDLDAIHYHLASISKQLHYKLANNIDLAAYLLPGGAGYAKYGTSGWLPFGQLHGENAFNGVFDGSGHTITGLWINRPEYNNVGLFGFAGSAVIVNLNIELSKRGIIGKHNVGSVVGCCDEVSIINCSTTGGNVEGIAQVGGLIGYSMNGNAIIDSFANVELTALYEFGNPVGANNK